MSIDVVFERSRTVAALERFATDLIQDPIFDYVVPVEKRHSPG